MFMAKVLLEEQKEKSALSEALLQTQGELSRARQQVQQLRQEVTEQQEKGQTIKANLQDELQGARREAQAAQRRHKEELQGLKEERNLLLEQREALQKQVAELTSQLAASRECQERTAQRAQQEGRETQEESRHKLMEIEQIQKMLDEAKHQNKELQVHLQNLERERSQWEEVAQPNSELQASVNALEREKARLILSLEEKDVCFRTLEEQNLALNHQVSQCQSALQQAKQISSNRAGQLRELNTQIRALQDAVLQMEASQATQQKQLLKELEESRAGERSVRDSVHVLQAEVSELRVRLQSSDDKALALAIQCEAVELELRKTQAQRDNLRARNLELQKELEEIEQDWWKEEVKHISRETALEKEATERQEEAVALRQEVASLRRKLEKLEKERKDVLVLVDGGDSMANSIICTDNPGNILSTLTSTDEQHPFELAREATENCERMWQQFDQVEERTQRIRSQYQLIDSLLAEIRSDCAKFEKSKEMLLQCTGTPETGAFCLQQQNTKQQKEASAQAEEAEQQDWMEVSQEQESSSWCLEQLSQESSGQGHEVAQAWREEELLAQKADLEGRLAATEWLRQDLARQLEETRSAKESLQSRLFAAQLQMAQLQMTWKCVEAELQGELQGARREAQAAQRRHKEELQGLKEEMHLLLEQREALQKQVAELTSQLAASRECQERTAQRAQQDGREAQEESRQKLLEIEQIQKMLEEAKHQNKELQMHLDYLERGWIQCEEMAEQNSDLQASVNALEREKARLILSLEEKNVCLRMLEEQNLALNNQVSQCQSALQQAKQLSSNRAGQLRELNTQIRALQDAVLQMEASQATQQKQLLKELEESRAGERSLRDSVHVLQAEVSELRVRLQSSDDKALALAIQCEAVELELRKAQAQRDNLRARNLELQKEWEEIEQDCVQAEAKHICHQIALEKEATERQEAAVALRQEVLVDGGDSMANSIICTDNPGNILSTLTSTDEQHPFELAWEATENCERMWQQFDQVEERTQRIRSQYQLIDSLLAEIRSDCAKFEKPKEMLLQCTGILETGAFCLQQQNTKQQKEASAQAEEAEQQDWMEVSQEQESSSWCLEQLSQESSGQGHEVAQAWREEELLAQKADLEGRLAATEWLRQDLARQLEETRSAKESLQSRLFAAQLQMAQLQMTWKRVEAELQGELQGARREAQAAQRRHKEELQGLKEEMHLLLEQREALQKQVAELTSQLAASRECQERTAQRAQQEGMEAQEESRQKLLEIEQIQKMLEEAEHQNKELQMHLDYLERGWIQCEEMAEQNSDLQASVNALEREKARLILSLEEKNVCLRMLEEQNLALNNQVSQCQSALQQAKQLSSNRAGQLRELNTQIRALQDAVLQMEASQATQQKQLLKELEESRAGERSLRDSVHVLQAEVSELRVRLQSSDDKALALAIQCEAVELELRKAQAQRDNLRARNLELQKEWEEIEQGMAGRHLRGCKRQLRHICQALEDKAEDISPATRSLALKTAFVLWAVERAPGSILQKLQDQRHRGGDVSSSRASESLLPKRLWTPQKQHQSAHRNSSTPNAGTCSRRRLHQPPFQRGHTLGTIACDLAKGFNAPGHNGFPLACQPHGNAWQLLLQPVPLTTVTVLEGRLAFHWQASQGSGIDAIMRGK
ncbi:centrosome-associated protein CEP250-like [Agelaius tricolor]|uniref:centrosome-associated protein CEP250-like n=1 Tax=Agelaius tricolor TaxID=9191 RepID=UPI0039F1975E